MAAEPILGKKGYLCTQKQIGVFLPITTIHETNPDQQPYIPQSKQTNIVV